MPPGTSLRSILGSEGGIPSDLGTIAPTHAFLFVPGREANVRNTFRKLWLAPIGALCLMTASSAEETSDVKKPAPAHTSIQQEAPEPSVTVLGSRQAQSVLGKEVRSSADENMGRIVD